MDPEASAGCVYAKHPEWKPITQDAIGKLVKKFKETENRKLVECRGEHMEHIM
jgi:hypothetical protein